jgi:hypothetical protein
LNFRRKIGALQDDAARRSFLQENRANLNRALRGNADSVPP